MRNVLGALAICCLASTTHAQNAAQRHILDAGINLGWAVGIIDSDNGVTAGAAAEIGDDLERAAAHIRALRAMVASPPYDRSSFEAVERAIGELATRIGGMARNAAIRDLSQIRHNFRSALSVYLSARTGRLTRGVTCDSAYADVGFSFGQAHTASQRGNARYAQQAIRRLQQAAGVGRNANHNLHCGFNADAVLALPVVSNPTSPEAYATALPRLQVAAGGAAGPAATPAATPATTTSGSRPNLRCPWRTNFGAVRFDENRYGHRGTLRGNLTQENGAWVWRGRWGLSNGSREGEAVFRFTSPTRFEGEWSERGTRRGEWTGSIACPD